jgi:D-cysteine desulfhydrase
VDTVTKRTQSVTRAFEFSYPPSVELAHLPTPLLPLESLGERLGRQVLCKRDDLTGAALSGNKVRKLEFLLAGALDQGATGVITCGGLQSNHARATALAAARLGLSSHLLLRTDDVSAKPPLEGNVLLDRLAGATIELITPEQYADRDALMAKRAVELGQEQADTVWQPIPEGGSNALGAWGYVRCVEELASQLGAVPATIVYAVGSGGTAAGLIAGCRLFDLPYRLIGVSVADDRATFQQCIASILAEMAATWAIDVIDEPEGIEIWDEHVGRGYGLSRDEELATIVSLAREEGLVLDPVYSGKAMHGLLQELENKRVLGDPIVFLHTGGIFGLFAKAEQLASLL